MRRLLILLCCLPFVCFSQHRATRVVQNPNVADCAGYCFRGHLPAVETYCAEAMALFARMTTQPTDARKTVINTFITSLKTAGVWSKLDAMYVLAAADQQAALLNWIADTNNATAENSPSFVADSGFKSDGSTSWVNTHYNPYQDSVHLSRVGATVSVYVVTPMAASDKYDVGCIEFNGSYSFLFINSCNAANSTNAAMWHNSAYNGSLAVTSSLGLTSVSRNATSAYVYKNGTGGITDTYVPQYCPNANFGICCGSYNWGGSPIQSAFSQRRISFTLIGGLLSATEQAALATSVETYMDAVGCGITP